MCCGFLTVACQEVRGVELSCFGEYEGRLVHSEAIGLVHPLESQDSRF